MGLTSGAGWLGVRSRGGPGGGWRQPPRPRRVGRRLGLL